MSSTPGQSHGWGQHDGSLPAPAAPGAPSSGAQQGATPQWSAPGQASPQSQWSASGQWSAPGQWSASGQWSVPMQWSAPTHPGPRTNTMALLAILAAAAGTSVLLGLGSIAAIVLGLIALAQIRRTGDDGRLLALWGVILGAVTLVALLVLTATSVVGIVQLVEELQTAGV